MPGRRAAPWSARAQFRAVAVALRVLPDEDSYLTPTRLPAFRPRLVSGPHFTVTPSAEVEPGTRFTRISRALRSLLHRIPTERPRFAYDSVPPEY